MRCHSIIPAIRSWGICELGAIVPVCRQHYPARDLQTEEFHAISNRIGSCQGCFAIFLARLTICRWIPARLSTQPTSLDVQAFPTEPPLVSIPAWLIYLTGILAYGVRYSGRANIPKTGAVLVVSNHQSHLDPTLVGAGCDRRMNYLARETLFHFAPLRWLIRSLDAIPIDRDGLGLNGIKESLRRLKRGEMVLIFPEGTRTRDGDVAPFRPGLPCSPPDQMPGSCPSPSLELSKPGRDGGDCPVSAQSMSFTASPSRRRKLPVAMSVNWWQKLNAGSDSATRYCEATGRSMTRSEPRSGHFNGRGSARA